MIFIGWEYSEGNGFGKSSVFDTLRVSVCKAFLWRYLKGYFFLSYRRFEILGCFSFMVVCGGFREKGFFFILCFFLLIRLLE